MEQLNKKSEHQLRVEEFMRLAKQEVKQVPEIPSAEVRLLRARLIFEEALETVKALGCDISFRNTNCNSGDFSISLNNESPSLAEICDGCADLSVVTVGTLSACGVPDIPLLELVDVNNLQKFGPGHKIREDGKLIKPPSHKPPDIEGFLASFR